MASPVSPRQSGLGRFERVGSMSSSASSSHGGLGGLRRTSTMSTVPGSTYSIHEPSRAQFQGQLHEMATAAGALLVLPPLLALPSQRASPPNPSDKSGAEEFLMSLRPKRALIGKSSKGFAKNEVFLALDKAIREEKPLPVIEALLQFTSTAAGSSGTSTSGDFTVDKKGKQIPTLDQLFTVAENCRSPAIWRLFLGRVGQTALNASLAGALKDRSNDIERIRALLEYGANPELCRDRILDLVTTGSEELIETLLLSQLLTNIDFLGQGLVKAAYRGSLRIISMLLSRGADGNFGQADALKAAISAQSYELALAIIILTKNPVSSNNLDEATGLIGAWSLERRLPFVKMLLYAGASGPRMSKALVPFIAAQYQEITSIVIECPAFRHSTFPAPRLFQFAIDTNNPALALEVLRSSNNRSFSDYLSTGVHLQLVRDYTSCPEETHKIISELLTLGVSGDYTSQMLIACCAPDQIESPHIMALVHLLIHSAGAKSTYSDGKAFHLAIEAGSSTVVNALTSAKPTKKNLSTAVAYTSSTLGDDNPAKLEIWSILLDAGASGPIVDYELVKSISTSPIALEKVKVLIKGTSLDYLEGNAVIAAIQLERPDLLELMLSHQAPQITTFKSIWKHVRKLFMLTESKDGHLPYDLAYMERIFNILHTSGKDTPFNELLLDATLCCSKEISLALSTLFLRWGASPNHSLGSPIQACIKRSDSKTLAALLSVETSKNSLKYGFIEALSLRGEARQEIFRIIIAAGLEGAAFDAYLPQVLREERYDSATVEILVSAGAKLHAAFGENLTPPAMNLDLNTVEALLPPVNNQASLLLPLKAVLSTHSDWVLPDGESLPMVKLLLRNISKGTWADKCFVAGVRSCNRHQAQLFTEHLTSDGIYSDSLQELLSNDKNSLDREKLQMAQYLLKNGARGPVIDQSFVTAAKVLDHEWVSTLHPYLSDRSVALTAFDLVSNGNKAGHKLDGNRLEIIQYLLKQGLEGPRVDATFIRAASTADLKGMNDFLPFVSSPDAFSEGLSLLAQNDKLLASREGLAAVELLINKGVSDVAVGKAARIVGNACSLAGVKLLIKMEPKGFIPHTAFEGLVEKAPSLSSPDSRAVLFYLLENGLGVEDTKRVARIAASTYDVAIVKGFAPLPASDGLYNTAAEAAASDGDAWLCPEGLEFIEYLVGKGVSGTAIRKLVEIAAISLHLLALQMLLPASNDVGKAAEIAFSSAVSNNSKWTSPKGLPVIEFVLAYGAKGIAVEEAAAYAAKTLNYDALDIFLTSPAAALAIPAAFKSLTRDKPAGQLSSDQLTIALTLVKQGVSTEVLSIAAIEMAKLLDIEGLKVLAQSPRFDQVTDDIIRALLLDEGLWRSPKGLIITQFLLKKGVEVKNVEAAASQATAVLDFDALRSVLELSESPTVIEAAFTSMCGLERGWLCPEGIRIASYLLQRGSSLASINKAFIQANQYFNLDAVKLLLPRVKEISVLNEALHRATSTEDEWLSALNIVHLLLESGVEGEAVEFALVKAAKALNLPALELLASKIHRPEPYTKAFTAATEGTQNWRHRLEIVEFLLHKGANGEPVDRAYLAASAALDHLAVTLLNPHIRSPVTHTKAFCAATSNKSWLSPEHLPLLEILFVDDVEEESIGVALVSAAEAFNVGAVELLSRKANPELSSRAFKAAMRDEDKWTSPAGSHIISILTEKHAHGDSVGEALVVSARLFRLDLVTVLVENIDKETFGYLSLAFDTLLSVEDQDTLSTGNTNLFNSDALEILRILVSKGATGETANNSLVRTALSGNLDAVNILSQVVNDPGVYTYAFTLMTESGTLWLQQNCFDLVAKLLSHGQADEGMHNALNLAIPYVIEGEVSSELLQLLLSQGADINFENGECLQLAARNGQQDLLEMLLQYNPNPLSLYMCLQAALACGLEEETVLGILKSIAENVNIPRPDANHHSKLGFPLLFYSLNNYPNSAHLAKETCELKADLLATIPWDYCENEYDDAITDQFAPLLVALEKDCPDDVINVLLSYHAQVNFTAGQSRVSALMLAAGKGRSSIVSTLIDRGASVIHRDAQIRTPLCHAARNGDLSTINSILKKNPARNDGSLHEAARELHPEAIKLLLQSGHHIDFPSPRHEGRTALGELCSACKGSHNPVSLQQTLSILATTKAKPLNKYRGRTTFFMAMENANPTPILTALLELFWRDLDSPDNVYEENDHFYSPTMYVKKGIINQPEATGKALLEILQNFSAKDRYYAKERMQQPRDAIGMPQRLMDLDNKKWIRSSRLEEEEEDFERKLRRADEEAANRQLISQRNHLMVMEQRENLGQQTSAHALDAHLLSTRLRDREHGISLVHQEEIFDRRLGEMVAGNQMKLNIEATQHTTKSDMAQQARDAQLLHEKKTAQQKLGYMGDEQNLQYTGLEQKQSLRLTGLTAEQQIERQKQINDLDYMKVKSGVNQADLNHQLQHTLGMNAGRVKMTRDLGDIDYTSRQRNNQLQDQQRQAQLDYEEANDYRKINTQGAMNQHAYNRNQNQVETSRAQSEIEREKRQDMLMMAQEDRNHQVETTSRMGQIQNQTLRERNGIDFYYLQASNHEQQGHQQITDNQRLAYQQEDHQQKFGFQQATHQEALEYQDRDHQAKFGFQQATDYQRLSTQQQMGKIQNSTKREGHQIDYQHQVATDHEKERTLGTQGRIHNQTLFQQGRIQNHTLNQRGQIENRNLHNKNNENLRFQNTSGNIKQHFQVAGHRDQLAYDRASGNQKQQFQARSIGMNMQMQNNMHSNRMGEIQAGDAANTRRVEGVAQTQYLNTLGNGMRHQQDLDYDAARRLQ